MFSENGFNSGENKGNPKAFQLFSLVTEPLQKQGHTATERREGRSASG